jgi:hypothetical protein
VDRDQTTASVGTARHWDQELGVLRPGQKHVYFVLSLGVGSTSNADDLEHEATLEAVKSSFSRSAEAEVEATMQQNI